MPRLIRSHRALCLHALVLAAFALLSVAITWPLALNLDQATADVGVNDPLLYARILDHHLAWSAGERPGAFDIDFLYPHPLALATTDHSFGVFVAAIPFLPFTRDLLALLNLGLLLSFVLTGHALFGLAREATGSGRAGVIAGAAFTFCLWRFHQLDHLSLLHAQWMLYAFWAFLRLRNTGSPAAAGLGAVLLWLHFVSSASASLYSVFFVGGFGVWIVASAPRHLRRSVFLFGLGAALVAGAALVPVYQPYLTVAKAHPWDRDDSEVRQYSGRVEQLRAAPKYNRLYGEEQGKLLGAESLTFPGFTVLGLAAMGLLFSRLRAELHLRSQWGRLVLGAAQWGTVAMAAGAWVGAPLALLALLTVVLVTEVIRTLAVHDAARDRGSLQAVLVSLGSLYLFASFGPEIFWDKSSLGEGIWNHLRTFSPLANVRTPARFFMFTSLALALLAASGVAVLMRRFRSAWLGWAVAVLALLGVLVESWSAPLPLRPMTTLDEAPPVYAWLAELPGEGAVLEVPLHHSLERPRMYFGTIHGRPTVNAESGVRMPVHDWVDHRAFVRGDAALHLERLRDAGLEYVVVHRRYLPGRLIHTYRDQIAAAGGERVKTFPTLEVWQLPSRRPVRSLSAETVEVAFEIPPGVAPGDPLRIGLSFAAATPEAVFEYRVRKLRLTADDGTRQRSAPVYLGPPLWVPAAPERRQVELAPFDREGRVPLDFTLTDEESGEVLARARAEVWFTPLDAWKEAEARFSAGGCELKLQSHAIGATGAHRWAFRVSHRGSDPWAGAALRSLRVVDATGRAVGYSTLPPLAPTASTLVAFASGTAPTFPLRAEVTSSRNPDEVTCSVLLEGSAPGVAEPCGNVGCAATDAAGAQ